jgi:hypothetical protein
MILFKEIVADIIKNNYIMKDDISQQPVTVLAVAKFSECCIMFAPKSHFSIHQITKDKKGILHLSQWNLGGTIDTRHCSMEQAIDNHNALKAVTKITDLTRFDLIGKR